MWRGLQGRLLTVSTVEEKVDAFMPSPLPPVPALQWCGDLREKHERAALHLGQLDMVAEMLPDTSLLLYMYVRKEAVLSSMIEGTQSSLSDLLLFELDEVPGVPLDDVVEVSSYVSALNHGLELLEAGLPLSSRLIKEVHGVLLSQGRGSEQSPGEFRRTQNWIGGTRPGNAAFVPPPADRVLEYMSDLEQFLNDQPEVSSPLLKAALTHVQFETIHPFLDGNGRLGRMLITLILSEQKVLRAPLLYLSLYFKTHRDYYYELLTRVRIDGEWEAWLDFFFDAVIATSAQAIETAKKLHDQTSTDQELITKLGRATASALKIHKALIKHPLATTKSLVKLTGLRHPTVNKSLAHLVSLGIVTELTSQKRNRVFSYAAYIQILSQGIDLSQEH